MTGRLARTLLLSLTLSAVARADPAGEQLLTAIANGDAVGVRSALAMGADPNYADPELTTTPLIIALGSRRSSIAVLLLEKGADPKTELAAGTQRVPAIVLAVKCDDPAIIPAMLERGADPAATDSYGNSALTEAASDGRADMIEALLAKGVGVDQLDGRQRTALMWAIKLANPRLVKLLLAHGANPNRSVDGQTLLQLAKSKDNAEIVGMLRKAGAK